MQEEFELKSKPDLKFRFMKLSMIELLSLRSICNFDNFEQTKALYTFIFEHTEVNIANQWVRFKEKGQDVYYPVGIESNVKVFDELFTYVMGKIIAPVFQKSDE